MRESDQGMLYAWMEHRNKTPLYNKYMLIKSVKRTNLTPQLHKDEHTDIHMKHASMSIIILKLQNCTFINKL
jgi:hypothetical protein